MAKSHICLRKTNFECKYGKNHTLYEYMLKHSILFLSKLSNPGFLFSIVDFKRVVLA